MPDLSSPVTPESQNIHIRIRLNQGQESPPSEYSKNSIYSEYMEKPSKPIIKMPDIELQSNNQLSNNILEYSKNSEVISPISVPSQQSLEGHSPISFSLTNISISLKPLANKRNSLKNFRIIQECSRHNYHFLRKKKKHMLISKI